MAKRQSDKLRRQRAHGVMPKGFKWRGGRPRWEPSPTRRRQGWVGRDLKDSEGQWLKLGQAVAQAEAIAQAVDSYAAGEAVPFEFLSFAPKGAADGGLIAAGGPRSVGIMLDAYLASHEFTKLATATTDAYRTNIKRFLQVVAFRGMVAPTPEAKADRYARFLTLDMDVFQPPAFGSSAIFELQEAYTTLLTDAGPTMAQQCIAAISAWMTWCVRNKRLWQTNPAKLVKRVTVEGRIVVFDWGELMALVEAAESLGYASVADAILLGVDLSWSLQDILAIAWPQISDTYNVSGTRKKTGNKGNPRLLAAVGQKRIATIRARWADDARPTHVIIEEATGKRWANKDKFGNAFREVRAQAVADLKAKGWPADKLEALSTKTFRDLRDTAVTLCYAAKMTIPQICSRTFHSPKSAQAIIHKHYGFISQDMSDEASDQLDAYFEAKGLTLERATPN